MISISPLHLSPSSARASRPNGRAPALSPAPACQPETADEELARLLSEAAHASRRNPVLEAELQACEVTSLCLL
jgi:hypothetical protein